MRVDVVDPSWGWQSGDTHCGLPATVSRISGSDDSSASGSCASGSSSRLRQASCPLSQAAKQSQNPQHSHEFLDVLGVIRREIPTSRRSILFLINGRLDAGRAGHGY